MGLGATDDDPIVYVRLGYLKGGDSGAVNIVGERGEQFGLGMLVEVAYLSKDRRDDGSGEAGFIVTDESPKVLPGIPDGELLNGGSVRAFFERYDRRAERGFVAYLEVGGDGEDVLGIQASLLSRLE